MWAKVVQPLLNAWIHLGILPSLTRMCTAALQSEGRSIPL